MAFTPFVSNSKLYAAQLNNALGTCLPLDGTAPMTGALLLQAGGTLSAALNYVYNYPSVPTSGYGRATNRYVVDEAMGGGITGINILDSAQLYVDGTDGNSWWVHWINYNSASAQDANNQRSDVVQYIAGNRQVSPAGLALGRTAVPSAMTTVATTLGAAGTAVAVENLAYLEWTFPANEGAVQVGPSNLGTVVIGSGTYEYSGISNGTSTDVVMGTCGPGTIYTTSYVSTSDATAGNKVIQCVAGPPIELQNLTGKDFSGYDSNRAGGWNLIEYAMNVAGPDSLGQTSTPPGVPVSTYGLLNGSAGSRYFLAFYPRFTQGNLGSECPYTQMEFHSYLQFNLPNYGYVKQGLLFYGGGTVVSSLWDSRSVTMGEGAYTFRVNNGDGIAWGGNPVGSGGLYGNGGEKVILTNGSSGLGENYLEVTWNGGATGFLTPGMKTRGGFGITNGTTLLPSETGFRFQINAGGTITLPTESTVLSGDAFLMLNTGTVAAVVVPFPGSGNVVQAVGGYVGQVCLLPGDYLHIESDQSEVWYPLIRSGLAGDGASLTVQQLNACLPYLQAQDDGRKMHASNGCANYTQTSGNGKGCPVYFCASETAWCAVWSGAAVTY